MKWAGIFILKNAIMSKELLCKYIIGIHYSLKKKKKKKKCKEKTIEKFQKPGTSYLNLQLLSCVISNLTLTIIEA